MRRWLGGAWRWGGLGIALVLLLGCPRPPDPAPLPPPIAALGQAEEARSGHLEGDPAPHVVVAFSVADRGAAWPCDCPDGAVGGWARKASLLGGLDGALPAVVAVAGPESLVSGPTDPLRERAPAEAVATRASLLGEAGVEVLVLGAADVAPLDGGALADLAAASPVPLVATNLRLADGRPVLPTVHVATRGAHRVAILSLLDPDAALPAGRYQIVDPAEAAGAALAALDVTPDAVVAFSDVPEAALPDLAARLRGVDFTVAATERTGRRGVVLQDGTRLVREEGGGTRVGLLDLVFSGPAGAPFVDDPVSRELAEQRLLAVVDEVRTALLGQPARSGRRLELDRSLPVGVVDGHTWGYRGTPLSSDLPEDPGIRRRLESL